MLRSVVSGRTVTANHPAVPGRNEGQLGSAELSASCCGGQMKLGLNLMRGVVNFGAWGTGFERNIEVIKLAESLEYDSVWTAEASGTDAIVPLAYVAAHTTRVKLGTAIMQMAARTPTNTAMTAATMDLLSGGRFILGLGVSNPMVVEGWHSQPYGKPLLRTREYISIVRDVIARQKNVVHHGTHYDIPYQRPDAFGGAMPIKLMFRPRRPRIPIYLAAMGPKNVRLALQTCDGIIPPAYSPAREREVFGEGGFSWPEMEDERESRGLPRQIDLAPFVPVAMGDDLEQCRNRLKPLVAFWLGAMGSRNRNFYNELARRAGFDAEAEKIQELYLAGRRTEAAAAVPDRLIDESSLTGPREHIAEQLEEWKKSSVTTMILTGADRDAVIAIAELVL